MAIVPEDETKMVLENYRLDKVVFELTDSDATAVGTYSIENIFTKRIKKISDDEFEFTLICDFSDSDAKKLPYRFHAEIIGRFMLENWESEENRAEREIITASVLFPLLRSYAVTVTINANMEPPLIMGLVSTSDWGTIKEAA